MGGLIIFTRITILSILQFAFRPNNLLGAFLSFIYLLRRKKVFSWLMIFISLREKILRLADWKFNFNDSAIVSKILRNKKDKKSNQPISIMESHAVCFVVTEKYLSNNSFHQFLGHNQ